MTRQTDRVDKINLAQVVKILSKGTCAFIRSDDE